VRFNDLTMIARMVYIHAQLPPEYEVEKGEMSLNSSSWWGIFSLRVFLSFESMWS
jgi:hypothetical protein